MKTIVKKKKKGLNHEFFKETQFVESTETLTAPMQQF